jgi:hypothetical protein
MTLKIKKRKTTVPRSVIRKAVEKVYALRLSEQAGQTGNLKPSKKPTGTKAA